MAAWSARIVTSALLGVALGLGAPSVAAPESGPAMDDERMTRMMKMMTEMQGQMREMQGHMQGMGAMHGQMGQMMTQMGQMRGMMEQHQHEMMRHCPMMGTPAAPKP